MAIGHPKACKETTNSYTTRFHHIEQLTAFGLMAKRFFERDIWENHRVQSDGRLGQFE